MNRLKQRLQRVEQAAGRTPERLYILNVPDNLTPSEAEAEAARINAEGHRCIIVETVTPQQ